MGPYYRTTRIGYDLVEKIIRSTPVFKYLEEINSPNKFKFNASKLEITYPNGNIVDFVSGNNVEALWGYKYHFVAIDEATRLKQEEVVLGDRTEIICPSLQAIMTTTKTTKAQIFCIFNPTTKRNTIWKWYEKAKAGEDERTTVFHMSTMDSVRAGFVDIEDYNYAKEHESPYIFRRDWEGQLPDEFNSVFKPDKVYDCIDDNIIEDISKVKYFGIDLGFSTNSSSDYTVITGIGKNNEVKFFRRFKKSGEDLINTLRSYINNRPCFIDATGAGLTVYDLLKTSCKNLEPYKFSNTTKQNLITTLAHYIHAEKIKYKNHDILINELCSYESDISPTGLITFGNGKGSLHDDSVCSLALAVLMMKQSTDQGDLPSGDIVEIDMGYDEVEAGWSPVGDTSFDYGNIY
jgi:hypothetical protein